MTSLRNDAATLTTYFASGSNSPAEIRGFAKLGRDIGVAAPNVSAAAERELLALAGTGIQVFVDSGAFSEMKFTADGPKVVKPITDEKWRKRLALYARLAAKLGSQLHVVAPDMIGNQEETARRLRTYAPELVALGAAGASVLVAIQKGNKTQADFAQECRAILGFEFVHALPCKKNATTHAELIDYIATVTPEKVHLLGMGERNPRMPATLRAFAELSPAAVVTCDSCLITASVGLTNGPGGGPRILTRCTAEARALVAAGRSALPVKELAIALAFGPALHQLAFSFEA